MSATPHDSEIGRWLESHGLGQYSAQFLDHGITLEVLPELTDVDLKECGVTLLGHRKQLLAAIRRLSATAPDSSAETPAVEETAAPAPKHVGHFELLEELGRGGMGIVYRAWDSSLNRQVAIKLLDPHVAAEDPKFLENFVREARAAASINHPHIVQIYFAGEDNGQYYLATELLEGQSMADRLERGPMDEKLMLRIARQITEALATTNTRRLIHGDIKPQNIFLTKSGEAKLLDFGLARKGNVISAEGGEIVGSIYYLSPERARGQAEDFRSDIFSLGATLFHGLTGLLPFEGDSNTAMLRQRVKDDAPRLRSAKPDASAKLDQSIARMMARDPAERYPSYDALLADLTAVEAERLAAFDPTTRSTFDLPPPPRGVSAIHPATQRVAKDTSAVVSAPTTPEASSAAKRGFWTKLLVGKFLFISIVAHLLFGIGATYFIVQKIQAKRKVTFQGGPPSTNPSKRALEHKVSMAQKKKTGGAPPQAKRIVSAGLAKVSLPDLPTVSTATSVPGMTAGMGGAGFGTGVGSGSGMGGGMGGAGGGGGGVPFFGLRSGGGGLAGAFYDLKQTKERKPTNVDKFKYTSTVFEFVRSGFQEGILKRYYQAPATLYAPMIMMPEISANEGPKAFGVEKDVQPSLWVALYEGYVIPPESGKYYFVGAGDDLLFVRVNGKLVLDRGWEPQLQGKAPLCNITKDYDYGWIKIPKGFARGEMFSVNAGQSYKIEILIGEQPGGLFSAALLLEKEGANYERDAKGNPILPVFRVANRPPPPSDRQHSTAPHMMDGPVWQVKPEVGIGRVAFP